MSNQADCNEPWWEKITLSDAASARGVVCAYLAETTPVDDERILEALPVLVLCIGDSSAVLSAIIKTTDDVCELADKDRSVEKRLCKWCTRLQTVKKAFTALSGCDKEVKVVQTLIERCGQLKVKWKQEDTNNAIKKYIKPLPKFALKKSTPKH